MDSIFLSYSFSKPEDLDIVRQVEDLFRSFGIITRTGLNLGGHQLTDQVFSLIDQSDALVAIASRREELVEGGWATHPWIRDEVGHARTTQKNAIVLVEDGVSSGGAYESYERIDFQRNNLDPALLKLAKTVGIWNDKAGNHLKVRLLPDDLLEQMNSPSCEYQFISRGNTLGWNEVKPILEPGGAYLHLQGVRSDYLIEVRVSGRNEIRRSRATAQSMPITVE